MLAAIFLPKSMHNSSFSSSGISFTTKPRTNFRRQVVAHAGHTKIAVLSVNNNTAYMKGD